MIATLDTNIVVGVLEGEENLAELITWDEGIYHTYFPGLVTVAP